jgi:hypothetical protein
VVERHKNPFQEPSLFLSSGKWISFPCDENVVDSGNVGVFAFQPPDAAGRPNKFYTYCIKNLMFCRYTV